MKKVIIILFFFTFIAFANGQDWKHIINKDDLTYQQKVEMIDNYFETNPDLINQKGSGYKQYKRWKEFVADRIDETNTTKNNPKRMFTYAEYLKENNNNEISKYYTDWKLLGPDTTPIRAGNPVIGSSPTGVGIIVSLWIDPQNYNIIFAGSNSGGLYKTTDGGENWIRKINGLPSVFGVNDIVVDPNNKNIMYICTGFTQGTLLTEYGYGIWKSIDGGENWQPTALNFAPTPSEGIIVHRMVINPVNPNIIYAVGKNKFFKTTDGFETYQMTSFENSEFLDINLRPNYPNTIFISGTRLFRSLDGGNTWNSLSFNVSNIPTNQFERIKVAFQQNNPDYLLCMFKVPDPVLICKILSVKSNDGGFTFTDVNNQGINPWPGWFSNPGYWKFELCVSPNNINTAYIGGVDLYKTIDGGNSVINISDNIHDDVRVLKVLNDNGNDLLFIGNDGGVAKSLNGNNNNINISGKGLAVNQFYGLGLQQNTSCLIYGGTQDCSIHFYKNHNWYNTSVGDGGDCYIDPANNKKIVGNMNGWPTISVDGENFTYIKTTSGMPRFDAPIIAQPNTNKIFGGFLDSVFYTPDTNQWNKWQFKSKLPIGSSGIRTMAFDPKNPNILYVGSPNPTWDPNVQAKKFWKSIDGGTTWTDLSANIPALAWSGISSIAIDPVNTQNIYLSFSNFWCYRVMKSTDGGVTWTNFSNGLPIFPVNKIKFNKNTNELFAGTDVGMFYYDNINEKWIAINQNMIPAIVTDFEFKYDENRIFIATFGAGIWYSNLNTTPIQPPTLLIVSRDTVINNGCYELGIKVTNKAKLTLMGNHYFAKNAGIIVEAGTKLILNQAVLSNDGTNSNYWQGITVLGISSQPSLFNKQGSIAMNYSTIKNAACAIKTASNIPNTNYNDCSGGIINVANSSFINNLNTIEMAPYNFDYVLSCGFKNCVFSFETEDYNFAELPKFFINLNGVKTISILGNQFTGSKNYDTINNISSGINSINSQIIVDEYKNNGQVISTNVFKKLCRGIKATTTIPGYTITINKTIFDGTSNVVLPIYISGYTNAVITSNNISVTQKKDNFVPYGIYLDNCTGYHFEDNTFNGSSVRYNHVGLVINNSGNDMNYIYRNKFDKITYAIIAQGNNRGNDIYNGLKIKCNNMGFNYTTWGSHSYMISVTNANDPQGISINQGANNLYDAKSPAGNLFYHHTKTISEYFNMGNHINYFHHDSASNPYVKPQKLFGDLTLFNTSHQYNSSCCPTTLYTGNNGGSNATEFIKTMNDELDAAQDGMIQLQQLKDGGNTEILKTEVELANSWQALQLRDELLNQSPFVTDTVLGSAIQNENALPNALLRQVLVANPHAAKNNTLMQQLDERNNPMPDYMLADIETGKTKVSAKEIMEANISEHLYNSAFAKNKLKAMFLNDTTDTTCHAAYRLLLTYSNKRNDKYELAYDYLKTGDINNGEITMTEAASDDMDDEENEEYLDNQLLFDIYKRLVSEDKWLTEVEERDITTIRNLAAKDKYMVHAWAKNWLQLVDQDYEYLEPVILPTNGANQRINITTKNTKIANVLIKLQAQPNPANDYIIIDYNMAEESGILEIRDAKGTIQYSQVLKSTKDQMVIETKSWKSGMYVCSLKSNTTLLKSIVIHIVK